MSTQTATQAPHTEGQLAAQRLFEAMFDHVPQVDLTRPPVPSPSAAERATWRKS